MKKMQEPDLSITQTLKDQCWTSWISYDEKLPQIVRPASAWYRVRSKLHSLLANNKRIFSTTRARLPKGSEFEPTRGLNSLESRLCRSVWTCTYQNFDRFAEVCYTNYGLRTACKRRYAKWFRTHDFDLSRRESDLFLYQRFKESNNVGFDIFRYKLSCITQFQQGSRFSTVPKNNQKRRPINVECFGNTLTQSVIGEGIREMLLKEYDIDLDTLSDLHRSKVSCPERWATIDLSNASDSVSVSLCRFLFPNWFMSMLEDTRSPFVLGPDGNYYPTKKISSMGNGFTFELMTLILTVLCKEFDSEATVFGDDITIHPDCALGLMTHLTGVGFEVNSEKSFWTGPFRESCGANYHSAEGYVESFDFHWPETIGDCVVLHNKAYKLSLRYPSFKKLYNTFLRVLPNALHGGPAFSLEESRTTFQLPTVTFPLYFVTPKGPKVKSVLGKELLDDLKDICYDGTKFYLIKGFEWKPDLKTQFLTDLNARHHWAKYLMYLDAGRRVKDVISDSGEYRQIYFISDGKTCFRVSTLKAARPG